MQIIKEVNEYVKTTDNHILEKYDEVIFTSNGKAYYGKFVGINARKDMVFMYNLGVKDFEWAVKPSSIDTMYKVHLEMERDNDETYKQ